MSRRREILRAVGGGLVVGLAGCTGSPTETPADTPTTSSTHSESPTARTTVTPTATLATASSTPSTARPSAHSTPTPTQTTSVSQATQSTTVLPADGDEEDEFGTAVALAGDTALVGAVDDEAPNGKGAGAAYVFTRAAGRWTESGKLAAAAGGQGDEFGATVALRDETALVGSPAQDTPAEENPGSVAVFERTGDGWTETAQLSPADGDPNDAFGATVALAGDTAFVGAPLDEDPNGQWAGAVYVFERTTDGWSEPTKLAPGDGDSGDLFGSVIAGATDIALVGAPTDEDPNGRRAGAVYVFERTDGTWVEQTKLVPADGDSGDGFGTSIGLSENVALVGAVGDEDPNGAAAGAAYAFERTAEGWTETAKLAPGDGDSGDRFGSDIAVGDARAVIGALNEEHPNGKGAGAAYVFEQTTGGWTESVKLVAGDGAKGDAFGASVALTAETVLVGAFGDDNSNGTDAGAAYVFDVAASDD